MLRFAAVLQTFAAVVTNRFSELQEDRERGSVSLEQVIITVALIAAAAVAVAAIAAAVGNRAGGIS